MSKKAKKALQQPVKWTIQSKIYTLQKQPFASGHHKGRKKSPPFPLISVCRKAIDHNSLKRGSFFKDNEGKTANHIQKGSGASSTIIQKICQQCGRGLSLGFETTLFIIIKGEREEMQQVLTINRTKLQKGAPNQMILDQTCGLTFRDLKKVPLHRKVFFVNTHVSS